MRALSSVGEPSAIKRANERRPPMATEYKTTSGHYTVGLEGEVNVTWPYPPREDDLDDPHGSDYESWVMVGSAAADGLLFWFWKRTVR